MPIFGKRHICPCITVPSGRQWLLQGCWWPRARLLIGEGRMNEESQQSGASADQGSSKNQTSDKIGALDELFRATLAYRRSKAYFDLMKFISRFPRYAPYNCFLLHTQSPTVSYVATPCQWRVRFGRT